MRPTASRVREALFNILGDVTGFRILDLFCGAGTLGLEALSRGAESAVFVDGSRTSLQCAQENVKRLGASASLLKQNLPGGIHRIRGVFDLVFCDPPYADQPLEALSLPLLECTTPDAVLVWEHDSKALPVPLLEWPSSDTRQYGRTSLTFLRRDSATIHS